MGGLGGFRGVLGGVKGFKGFKGGSLNFGDADIGFSATILDRLGAKFLSMTRAAIQVSTCMEGIYPIRHLVHCLGKACRSYYPSTSRYYILQSDVCNVLLSACYDHHNGQRLILMSNGSS